MRFLYYWFAIVFTLLPYLAFAMIVVDRFPSPFDRFVPAVLPWKAISVIPQELDLPQRIALMQGSLKRTQNASRLAFGVMIVSFVLFGANAARFFQQQKRRTEENRLLELKNQEIARRTEFIRHISATIGHEFKNNVARIKRRMELLPELPPEARQRIEVNFEKLFSDIDIFKRIADEREAGLVRFQDVDLANLLGELAQQYGDFVDVTILRETDHARLYASLPLIWAVFENLFDNAVKYKKPGQKRAVLRITLTETRDGDRRYLSISFRDEGIGMTEEQAEMCFYKGSSQHGGWGEGLYFSKYVIGLHAGRIRIGKGYTAPGTGAEVLLHLPYVEEEFHV